MKTTKRSFIKGTLKALGIAIAAPVVAKAWLNGDAKDNTSIWFVSWGDTSTAISKSEWQGIGDRYTRPGLPKKALEALGIDPTDV